MGLALPNFRTFAAGSLSASSVAGPSLASSATGRAAVLEAPRAFRFRDSSFARMGFTVAKEVMQTASPTADASFALNTS
jgi:hypothetical protein